MNQIETLPHSKAATSFFDRPQVQIEEIPVGPGIPLGIECARNPLIGIGGVYGTWGQAYDNDTLPQFVEERLRRPLRDDERMNLSELGFLCRHHLPRMSPDEYRDLEIKVGVRFLTEAARASGWDPAEVEAVLAGISSPVMDDYVERIATEAGIPESALKVSVHKACDGAVGALHLALNPQHPANQFLGHNLAEKLYGKKVLVGGIEGLSRVTDHAFDSQALQLFGNGAGVFGLIPGRTMKFLVGGTLEAYDTEGVLQLRMTYPHSRRSTEADALIEVTESREGSIRVAGLQHEPEDPSAPVVMAAPMGMVKLFVRNGVVAVRTVYQAYRQRMAEVGMTAKDVTVAVVHHANLKINQLKEKQLNKEGISMPMPWLLSDFGNVSAASSMIAFLRKLGDLKPGDHVLFDGFGAGTYYDVVVAELGS